MTSKEEDILRDLWRFSVSERYTDEEIRKALDKAIETMKKDKQHGKWIDLGDNMILRWVCSKCGRKDRHIFNFCPDCGADMRKEGENNEQTTN